tara:strand:- start:163848 stop:164351 length:504 start_codon:yes stop_codon:yes gene_type:complete
MRKMTLVALICLLSVSYLSAQENSKSTYYLIRHAEKDRSDATVKNPELSKKGQKRAVKWSEILNKFGINEVYSTDYKRTLNTVKPTAKANKITVKTYHPFKLDYEQFLVDTKGKNVLIAGHSNTTASFANKLIGKEVYPEMSDDNNANLYIVTIDGDTISHVMIVMQ